MEVKKVLDPEKLEGDRKNRRYRLHPGRPCQSFSANRKKGYSRIIEIVSQLKEFSRIDNEAKRAPYEIEKGVESTLVIAWNELKYVADVKKKFAGVGSIEADGGAVNQVLLNIIVNGAQAIASQKRNDRGSSPSRREKTSGTSIAT